LGIVSTKDESGPGFSWPPLLAILMGVYVLFTARAALVTSRPDLESIADPHRSAESFAARMWEDPLLALDRHIKGTSGEDLPPSHETRAEFGRAAAKAAGEKVVLLPVFLDSQSYSEAAERRLRTRYAVLSAVNVAGFEPVDGETLRYVELGDASKPLRVPYESFVKDPGLPGGCRWDRVVILWLSSEELGGCPLETVRFLASLLDEPPSSAPEAGAPPPPLGHEVRCIGPTDSTSLLRLLAEADQIPEASRKDYLKNIQIFSDRATLPNAKLIPPGKASGWQHVSTDRWESNSGLVLERTIDTDEILADKLVDELALREALFPDAMIKRGKKPTIVLVSEWDTPYARAWESIFREAVARRPAAVKIPEGALRTQAYLRGLDGKIPGGRGSRSKGSDAAPEGDKPKTSATPEQPEGTSQLDYVRRIEDILGELEGGEVEITAIGILGSDLYDKILLLRALRQDFPKAVFFTTDLDVRYVHPEEIGWTRNLIVASPFGLRLDPSIQSSIPPFRDSYQTSTFFGTLKALDCPRVAPVARQSAVYEVGQHDLYDLSKPLANSANPPSLVSRNRTEHGRVLEHIFWGLLLFGVSVFPLVHNLFGLERIRPGKLLDESTLVFGLVLCVLVCGLMAWFISVKSLDADEEPFTLFGGISVWPTEFIRTLAMVLAFSFILALSRNGHRSFLRIEEEFPFLKAPTPPLPVPPGACFLERQKLWLKSTGAQLWSDVRHRFGEGISRWIPKTHTHDAALLWKDYVQRQSGFSTFVRALPYAALYYFFLLFLFHILGFPNCPVRGEASRLTDRWILMGAVGGLLVLLFSVIDVTRLCARLIDHIARGTVNWPPEFLEKTVGKDTRVHRSAEEYLNIRLIAFRTGYVVNLMYYPCFVLVLLLVARNRVFDAWNWNIPLAMTFFLSAAGGLYGAFVLRSYAERARRKAMEEMKSELLLHHSAGEEIRSHIERLISLVEEMKRGAFLPLLEHPLLHVILIPFSGLGAIELAKLYFGMPQ
jgi:hypothetical protein